MLHFFRFDIALKIFREANKWSKAPKELESHIKRAYLISEELLAQKRMSKGSKRPQGKMLKYLQTFHSSNFSSLNR